MRALMRIMGAGSSAGTLLLSYLLFERGFTRAMIELGVQDTRARGEEIREFLRLKNARKLRPA
jgi:NTE family protein